MNIDKLTPIELIELHDSITSKLFKIANKKAKEITNRLSKENEIEYELKYNFDMSFHILKTEGDLLENEQSAINEFDSMFKTDKNEYPYFMLDIINPICY
jgi:hypothetical protein